MGGSGWPMDYYHYHHFCLINELVVGKCWCTISEATGRVVFKCTGWQCQLLLGMDYSTIQEKAASVVGNGECGWSASSLGVIMSTEL